MASSQRVQRLEEGQVHDGRFQDLGSYTVYRGGKLINDKSDMTGRRLIGGTVVAFGKVGGERVPVES